MATEFIFVPGDRIQVNNARITYKNFSGIGGPYNRDGDRNFALIIDDPAVADKMASNGWNVRVKPPRNEGEEPFIYLPVKVKFSDYGPSAYLISGSARNELTEETIGRLDRIRCRNIDLDIRPYDWDINGKQGRTAYLDGIEVIQEIDRFAARYAENMDDGEPWE